MAGLNEKTYLFFGRHMTIETAAKECKSREKSLKEREIKLIKESSSWGLIKVMDEKKFIESAHREIEKSWTKIEKLTGIIGGGF